MRKILLVSALVFVANIAHADVIRGSGVIYDSDAPECSGLFIYDSSMPLVKCSIMRVDASELREQAS